MNSASSMEKTQTPLKATNQGRRSSLAGFFGSALEYYDMYIYASASALVFSRVFFPDSGALGLLLSLGTYGVAYLARPLGGFLAGHFGDVLGRKKVLIATLSLMGGATFLIGCLPAYDTIGMWAPAALVTLRLLQGVSVGGEAASASSLTLEHAPEGRRALYTSWMVNGVWVGYILATLAFIAVATLPTEQMYAWGWRIPFWMSAGLLVIGLIIRKTIVDPEAFAKAKENNATTRAPIGELLRHQPLDLLRVIFGALFLVISTTVPVYGLTYATSVVGIKPGDMLWTAVAGYALALVTQPLLAVLSDRIGRKPVMIAGNLLGAIVVWQFFWAVSEANIPMIYLGMFLCISVAFAGAHAVYPSYFAELFDVRYRISGMAIGLQIGVVITGFSPTIIQLVSSAHGNAWWPAAALTSIACVVSAIAIGTGRETHKVALGLLGKPQKRDPQDLLV